VGKKPTKENYIAKTVSGLEEALARELEELGAVDVMVLKRAVGFAGDRELLYRANYCCRTVLRILRPLARFPMTEQEDLYRGVSEIPWENFLEPDKTFVVDSVVSDSVFTNSQFVSLRTKDAIADRLRKIWNFRPSVSLENPDIRVNVHIYKGDCDISLDSSGESLHKRGYRKSAGLAPINEVLAAGLIRLTQWDGSVPFVDPMCGSGTFLIEAAMFANRVPAGYFRESFSFMKWKDFDPELWHTVKEKADHAIVDTPGLIYGSDISPRAARMAEENARLAGFANKIKVEVCPLDKVVPYAEGGILVTNPPYDERMQMDDIIGFYKTIGDVLKRQFTGYTAWVISSDIRALKFIGLHPSKKLTLYNGPLECRFVRFKLY
jgi:putative N6-adenine-specific DNA methylase